jgi:hypothetical protein
MRQERKPEAGKYKHNHAEHPIWIVDRRTCALVCFVLRCVPKRYLAPQLLHFSFVLDRIVHLPVPSEIFIRRGTRFLNLAGNCVAGKTQESSGNHTTRLYGVQEAICICIYRRDLDNTPGSRRE